MTNKQSQKDKEIYNLFSEFTETLTPPFDNLAPQILIYNSSSGLAAAINNNNKSMMNPRSLKMLDIYDVSFKICAKNCTQDNGIENEIFFSYAANKGVDIYLGGEESNDCCLKAELRLIIHENNNVDTLYRSMIKLFLWSPYCVLYVAPSLTINNKMTALRIKTRDVALLTFNKTVVNLESS
tara:strand:- start:93 stop:638 length:546 start_codon:yes stop_codon:yes gene_type:complete